MKSRCTFLANMTAGTRLLLRVFHMVVIFKATTLSLASPSASESIHEHIVGGNREIYITLKQRVWSPPSYYSYNRSLTVCTYESSTGKSLKSYVIETAHHTAPDAENWTTKYENAAPVDLAKIIRSIKDFEYAWPVSPDRIYGLQLFATPKGIAGVSPDANGHRLIIPVKALLKTIPWYLDEVQTDAEKCESCGLWGDPNVIDNDQETSGTGGMPRSSRSRAHCSHVQVVHAYHCGSHLYAVMRQGSEYLDEGGARSAIVRIPPHQQDE